MDDPLKPLTRSSENKTALPDVVHTPQIPTTADTQTCQFDANLGHDVIGGSSIQAEEISEIESITEEIPSRLDYSNSEYEQDSHDATDTQKIEADKEKISKTSSLHLPLTQTSISEHQSTLDPSKESVPSPEVNETSEYHISKESPVNLPLSFDLSKDDIKEHNPKPDYHGSSSNDYVDSVHVETHKSVLTEIEQKPENVSHLGDKETSLDKVSSESEEIIKLDIRGKAKPKFPLQVEQIIYGPPPEGGTIIAGNIDPIPIFPNLLSPFLVSVKDIKIKDITEATLPQDESSEKLEQIFQESEERSFEKSCELSFEESDNLSPTTKIKEEAEMSVDLSLEKSGEISPTISVEIAPTKSGIISPKKSGESQETTLDKTQQSDLLVEEVTVQDVKEKDGEFEDASIPTQTKSMEDTMLFSTLTDYKTICEEYEGKFVHMEAAILQRDRLIEDLTISLQRSVHKQDELRLENQHLTNEVQHLQHVVGEHSHSDHDTVKAQLSDYMKYQTFVQDNSKQFYSTLTSGDSSMHSSNGEKDMDHEEMTVNYSKSDLKSSGSSDDFQTGFETKINVIINKFDEFIEENLRNKLRESIIQVLCDEIGKIRMETDTEVKEVENQIAQDKQSFLSEVKRLRELLASVKAGNADIDVLREELNIKHEGEMANLRTYFEKKCCDMERSYSEEVWRGRTCASDPEVDVGSLEPDPDGAGDRARRRTRSADLPSLSIESNQLEQALKQLSRRYEQQIEDIKTENLTYMNELQVRHSEEIASLEEQISHLKAHIQTAENTEANVSLYQQDIDLELEKEASGWAARVEAVRGEVISQLQEQIQVLLSDPDAEVSSWPLELVALRDKIYADRPTDNQTQHKELSSLRDELSGGEPDKWKQRRNISFDQNRQIEEVTKERDGLKLVAASLQRVVGQLVAYCAACEDELNRTVLAQLLARLLPHDPPQTIITEEESRPVSPNVSDLNASLVSKHVHFAPDLNSVLSELDEDGIVGFLNEQRDLSVDIKRELDLSLRRLRHEAHDLLDLSARLAANNIHQNPNVQEESEIRVTEIAEELTSMNKPCENCELHRKNMEDAMAECLQRESLLRSDLEGAMMKIAQLMTSGDREASTDLIAEGYGTSQPLAVTRPRPLSESHAAALSLDTAVSPRLARDVDALCRERDDLLQQLEAANRQLRSTRQFVEEQAAEREAERDEFAATLADLRAENARLAARLQTNARILNEMHELRTLCSCRQNYAHMEQLESQTREMNQIILDLESKKAAIDEELKATSEKIPILRDVIASLEGQLEQKTAHEAEILQQLEEMKRTIDDRDRKMREVLGELDSMRSLRLEQSEVVCSKCALDEEKYNDLMEKLTEQAQWLEEHIHHRTHKLERLHEVCSTSCSEPSEDVSLRDQKNPTLVEASSPTLERRDSLLEQLRRVWEALQAAARAEDAALKRLADLEMQRNQLKDVAQEVRAERDVLQARMSEQALRLSSLAARLDQQRNDASALAHQHASDLSVQLHDALAEVQRLKEELESKDKHLARLKQTVEERDKKHEENAIYGYSCNPKDKVIILERELSSAQSRVIQLEALVKNLENEKGQMQSKLREQQILLAEKEDQLQDLMALKLEDDNKDDNNEALDGAKTSARTLSDIVSISEYDEQDLQMRKAELKTHNLSIGGALYPSDNNKTPLNKTQPPNIQQLNMSSLNVDYKEKFDDPNYTPQASSLPIHLISTQTKDMLINYKRNIDETTTIGSIDKFGDSVKHSTAQKIPDNCSLYPNRNISDGKSVSVEPKRINFDLEPSNGNKTNDEEFTSLRELGITLDIKQENFPDILTQLKHEIKKSKVELDNCKTDLKNAEEQLCEFPALKEEVEQLKTLLENTMATMDKDKKFYEKQLDNFTSNKSLLEKRVNELTQEVNEKTKDLHLLKEDILRRENMILELAKEKRNLTNKMAELDVKIDELQSRNSTLEKYETESKQMKNKMLELHKLEQLVSEKNQQIDSLNQHLDRLDDLQRNLNDKTEEFDHLKEAFEEKSNEVFQLQDAIDVLNSDIANVHVVNKDLKDKLNALEKEQENASIKLASNESELQRLNSLNSELSAKIEELKQLNIILKDKDTELEILNEDVKSYHDEIATLKEQLKMVSRSPSPRNKSGEERKSLERQANNDKKHLVKIRKQISMLQHELDFNKKELNDKAFELARARLDVSELKNNLSLSSKQLADKEQECCALRGSCEAATAELERLREDKRRLAEQLEGVVDRLREESNMTELKAKLRDKTERCQELELEVQDLKELVDRIRSAEERSAGPRESRALAGAQLVAAGGARSPTLELERAVRDTLHYSHRLDDDIMDQILSASSDEREDIPRLALNTSKSSSSIHSTSSDRLNRLKTDNEKLLMQVNNLEARLKDKDALITELNKIRDKLVQDWQAAKLRYEAEKDNSGRLQLLLDTHKETSESLQYQDSNMIQILKKRLESAMQSEVELQQNLQQLRNKLAQAETQTQPTSPQSPHVQHELERSRLQNSVHSLKSRLAAESAALGAARAELQRERSDLALATQQNTQLKAQLAELKRLKHDAHVELARAKELLAAQSSTIAELDRKLNRAKQAHALQPVVSDALTEIESHKSELAREISSLKKCLVEANSPEIMALREEKKVLLDKMDKMEREINKTGGEEREQALRYLHGRCLRLESCRKALVWQKRYLQRVLAGYTELEKKLKLDNLPNKEALTPIGKFKRAAWCAVWCVRLRALVLRRERARAAHAHALRNCAQHLLLYSPATPTTPGTPGPRWLATERARDRDGGTGAASAAGATTPLVAERALNRDNVARRALRLQGTGSPARPHGDFANISPFRNSPQREREPFILNSPRSEVASAYLNKLELVSQCLNQVIDAQREVP